MILYVQLVEIYLALFEVIHLYCILPVQNIKDYIYLVK